MLRRGNELEKNANGATLGFERDNPFLEGVLLRYYARPALDKQRLGQLIDLFSNLTLGDESRTLGPLLDALLPELVSGEPQLEKLIKLQEGEKHES